MTDENTLNVGSVETVVPEVVAADGETVVKTEGQVAQQIADAKAEEATPEATPEATV
jgi:hypothetical protein